MAKGYTARMMQLAMIEELEGLFKDKKFNGQQSKKSLKVFKQNLPIDDGNDEDADTDAAASPYIVVILGEGSIKDPDSPQIVSVMLTICCYDEGKEREGYEDVQNIIEDILQHFCVSPQFGAAFEVMRETDHEMQWAIQQDDTYPYYFGAVLLDVTVPAMTGDQNNNWGDMI